METNKVVIYQPAKTSMQSGQAKNKKWILEFVMDETQQRDALMGWTGGGDTRRQVKLSFDTQEQAIAFATQKGLEYEVRVPKKRALTPKSYSANFAFNRKQSWTH